MADLQATIEDLWARRDELGPGDSPDHTAARVAVEDWTDFGCRPSGRMTLEQRFAGMWVLAGEHSGERLVVDLAGESEGGGAETPPVAGSLAAVGVVPARSRRGVGAGGMGGTHGGQHG